MRVDVRVDTARLRRLLREAPLEVDVRGAPLEVNSLC
jgi:hypothetical protein